MRRDVLRIAFWTALLVLEVLSTVSPGVRPVVGPHAIEHAATFLLLGALFAAAYDVRPRTGLFVAIIIAGSTELVQLLAPGRHARMSDFIIDAAAAMAGVLLATFLRSRWNRLRAAE